MKDDVTAEDFLKLGQNARAAQRVLALAPAERKNRALLAAASRLREAVDLLLMANAADVEEAKAAKLSRPLNDRLTLDGERVSAITRGLETIAALPDPVGEVTAEWGRPNGLRISRVRVPIGVIGIIFESRPHVAAEAGALTMQSGNSDILRGGSDSHRSSRVIVGMLQKGLEDSGLPPDAIQMIETSDRTAVGAMLEGLGGALDLIVPRGGKSLVERIKREARVPVFAHLEGICHVYVHRDADVAKAKAICLNSKMRRTSVCGAAETILFDEGLPSGAAREIVSLLIENGCEVRGDAAVRAADARVVTASEKDWMTENLDAIVSIRTVPGIDEAVAHIARYGSQHTDSIVTENADAAEKFMNDVDSAIVLHNASTQLAYGGEFGFGAVIGIATGRMHARGPVGLEQLTTFKYKVRGSGQIRP